MNSVAAACPVSEVGVVVGETISPTANGRVSVEQDYSSIAIASVQTIL